MKKINVFIILFSLSLIQFHDLLSSEGKKEVESIGVGQEIPGFNIKLKSYKGYVPKDFIMRSPLLKTMIEEGNYSMEAGSHFATIDLSDSIINQYIKDIDDFYDLKVFPSFGIAFFSKISNKKLVNLTNAIVYLGLNNEEYLYPFLIEIFLRKSGSNLLLPEPYEIVGHENVKINDAIKELSEDAKKMIENDELMKKLILTKPYLVLPRLDIKKINEFDYGEFTALLIDAYTKKFDFSDPIMQRIARGKILSYLILGADPTIKTKDGKTVADLVENEEMKKFLEELIKNYEAFKF